VLIFVKEEVLRMNLVGSSSLMVLHLELGRHWKVTVFYTFCVKRRVRIFNTKNLYGNDT
jgi:hypothetical protein